LGKTPEEQALVEEWLSLSQKKFVSNQTVQSLLPRLERDLLRVVFLVNNRETLADLALFAAVRPYVSRFDQQQKRTFVNICRWFDFIQHQDATLSVMSLIDLHAPDEIYSSILSEFQSEKAAALIRESKQELKSTPLSFLPDGKNNAAYPEGPKPTFGFAFMGTDEGLLVTHVLEAQAAFKAGLLEGDFIDSVNGHQTRAHKDFFGVVREISPGHAVVLKIRRNGTNKDLTVITGASVPVVSSKKAETKEEEQLIDKQRQAKKQLSKQSGEISKSSKGSETKTEPVKLQEPSKPETSAESSSAVDAMTAQGNLVRSLKASGAPKAEIDAAVEKLKQLKEQAGVDTGKKKKK